MVKLYAELKDAETQEYQVINQVDAELLGWKQYELDVSYDGRFYAVGCAPQKPQSEINTERVRELKKKLSETDYVVTKIAEGVATKEEYADIIQSRQSWRAEINLLED